MSRPVLVIDNEAAGAGYVAVCVASLEGVGRTTSLLGSQAAGAATGEYSRRLGKVLRADDQLIQIHDSKHCLLIRGLRDRNHANLAGMKLERLFAEPFHFHEVGVPLEVRVGIACAGSGEADPETLFRAAETAREAARSRGKVFELADDVVVGDMRRVWRLNDEVDEALFQHQLKLYYQPKVAADGHELCGAEGLVRWEHPDGLLNPGQFLPHLERDKMIALTRHVVRQAIRDLAANPWLPPLSINLDPEVTREPAIVQLIRDELTLWNVDPRRLVVEITENGIVQDVERLLGDFAELRARGVRLSMDDFGTGNSSLAQFRNLLVDELKIDRAFVTNIEQDQSNRYLAGLIIDLAHYFGMSVVAEGVETPKAAEVLLEAGCDALQGFFFSPPVSLEEFSRWAEGRRQPPDCA